MSSSKISRVISTSSGGNEYRIIDMILIGSGIIIIICLLVYIYNQFIHKRYNKNEYFDGRMVEEAFSIQPCHSDKLVCDACSNGNDKLVCEKCPNGRDETTGTCNPSIT
jgi:hypothetical protein